MLHAHRTPVAASQQRGKGLKADIKLGAEASADVMADHAHCRRRHAQHLGDTVSQPERVLVGHLDDVAARLVGRERHLGLQMRLVLPGRAVRALHDDVGGRERLVEVSRVMDHFGYHVAVTPNVSAANHGKAVPIGVDQPHTRRQCLFGRRYGLGRFDVDVNRLSARVGRGTVVRHHDRHRFAFVSHIVGRQEGNVVHDDTGAPIGNIGSCQHIQHAVDLECRSRVDRADAARRNRRPRDRRPQHPRPCKVGTEDRLATKLRVGIAPGGTGPEQTHDVAARIINWAASSAASTICWYPVQRQMVPASARRTSASEGSGVSSSKAVSTISTPGVQ